MSAGTKACPNEAEHTPSPRGYIAWHGWAERKGKTHRQVRCRGCGLFAIWVRKPDGLVPVPVQGQETRA